jgi:hypothetical protein
LCCNAQILRSSCGALRNNSLYLNIILDGTDLDLSMCTHTFYFRKNMMNIIHPPQKISGAAINVILALMLLLLALSACANSPPPWQSVSDNSTSRGEYTGLGPSGTIGP